MENMEAKIDLNKVVIGEWTKVDVVNKLTEVSFLLKNETIATMTFDFASTSDKILIEGDLSKVTGSEDNADFIKTYEDCSKEVLNIQ